MAYKFSTGSFAIEGRGSSDNGTPTVLSSSGKVSASYFYGDGGGITGISSTTVKTNAYSTNETNYPVFVNESTTTAGNSLTVSSALKMNPQGLFSASLALSSSVNIMETFYLLTASSETVLAKAIETRMTRIKMSEPYGIQVWGTGSGLLDVGISVTNVGTDELVFIAPPDGAVTASFALQAPRFSGSTIQANTFRAPGNSGVFTDDVYLTLDNSQARISLAKTTVLAKAISVTGSAQTQALTASALTSSTADLANTLTVRGVANLVSGLNYTGSNLVIASTAGAASAKTLTDTDAVVTVVSGGAQLFQKRTGSANREYGMHIALPASPTAGEIHTIKRSTLMTASNTSGAISAGLPDLNVVLIAGNYSGTGKKIDGAEFIFLESPGAAVNLIYDGTTQQWNIF